MDRNMESAGPDENRIDMMDERGQTAGDSGKRGTGPAGPRSRKRCFIPFWAGIPVGLLLAGLITILALWCQPNRLANVLMIFLQQPVLIVLNYLPILLLLSCLSFLTHNVFLGAALTELPVGVLSIANRIKIEVRDEPVFPRDLALLREVSSAMQDYHISYPAVAIAAVILLFAVLLAAGILVGIRPAGSGTQSADSGSRTPAFGNRFPQGWRASLGGAAASLLLLILACFTVLGSNTIYSSIETSNSYRLSTVFNETGFPYGFCRMLTTYSVDKPDGYSREEAEAWDGEPGETEDPADVHVIFVMNEAFSDLTDQPVFRFEEDPLKNLHAIREEEHCLYGRLVVPGFCGGTANTEFDVTTGMQTRALSENATSAMRVVDRNQDSLFRVFGGDGYHTSFMHPGYGWFYNRQNVYPWLGASETIFEDQMENPEYLGSWISDAYTAGQIEDLLADAVSRGQYLFNYTTSIQNHMSYTYDKYGDDVTYPEVAIDRPVSEETQMMAEVYAAGARDADAMLGELHDAFAAGEEPVVLVFYGDHLPYLGDSGSGYRELGIDVTQLDDAVTDSWFAYETPYIIWANDSAAELLDWDSRAASLDLPQGGSLSAAFLGAAVLELTGRGYGDSWFGFLNELRRSCPVVQGETLQLADGTICRVSELADTELADRILKWRKWSYYKLCQKIMQD